ncbi:MAG: hypothetical protein U1E47_01155 [Rivihabitans pingtungensis]
MVTRPAGQAGALMAKLAAAGATPIALPVIDIAPADAATLRAAADVTWRRIGRFLCRPPPSSCCGRIWPAGWARARRGPRGAPPARAGWAN